MYRHINDLGEYNNGFLLHLIINYLIVSLEKTDQMPKFVVGQHPLTCDSLVAAAQQPTQFSLSKDVQERIKAARTSVDAIVAKGAPVYGVNTGVGSQKDYRISKDEIAAYNRKLIRAHGTRVPGEKVDPVIVRAMLIVQIHQLASGYAGVSPELIDLLLDLASSGQMPSIDAHGSVGVSDLVPLSQLSDWVLSQPKAQAQGLPGPKDALAMINFNGLSLAMGASALVELSELLHGFDLAAAMTMEGFKCNLDAISEPVVSVTCRSGQKQSASRMRAFLQDSQLWQAGENRFLQDPLSFRNVTQVHGAALECANWLRPIWDEELQSCAVNPLVNIGDKPAYSHGNMDATRMTLALDAMRLAIAKMADLTGERSCKQQWPAFSGLPIGLAGEKSVSSGVQFLNLSHIHASLITSVKIAANPHLLHSVGQVADGVEDTASHAVHAAAELQKQIDLCWSIITLETIIAAWAIDRRAIAASQLGKDVAEVYEEIRPYLPIGEEGNKLFDLGTLVTQFCDVNRRLFQRGDCG